LNRGAWSRP